MGSRSAFASQDSSLSAQPRQVSADAEMAGRMVSLAQLNAALNNVAECVKGFGKEKLVSDRAKKDALFYFAESENLATPELKRQVSKLAADLKEAVSMHGTLQERIRNIKEDIAALGKAKKRDNNAIKNKSKILKETEEKLAAMMYAVEKGVRLLQDSARLSMAVEFNRLAYAGKMEELAYDKLRREFKDFKGAFTYTGFAGKEKETADKILKDVALQQGAMGKEELEAVGSQHLKRVLLRVANSALACEKDAKNRMALTYHLPFVYNALEESIPEAYGELRELAQRLNRPGESNVKVLAEMAKMLEQSLKM